MSERIERLADRQRQIEVAVVSPRGCSRDPLAEAFEELGVRVFGLYRSLASEGDRDQAALEQWQYALGHIADALVVNQHDSKTGEVAPLDASTKAQINMANETGTPVYMTHPVDGAHDAQILLQELGLRE